MTLASHAVAGASAAIIFRRHPWLGLAAALASHFLLDAIPHWHYVIPLKRNGKWKSEKFAWDADVRNTFLRTGADSLSGTAIALILVLLVSPEDWLWALSGAVLGVLPDFLQFLEYLTRSRLLIPFQRLHKLCHAKLRLDDRPVPGPAIEFLAICASAGLAFLTK